MRTTFVAWARENPTEFYKIAARLIAAEVNVREDRTVTVIVNRGASSADVPLRQPTQPALKGYVDR